MRKSQKPKKKKYIRKFRVYPAFLYKRLDKWLKKMSSKGLHVVDCRFFTFIFEKGEPKEKEYFTYGDAIREGKYSLSMRHPFLEKRYGSEKSKINKSRRRTHRIIEIDTKKIDIKNDVGYKELISDRNKLYLRYFILEISVITIPLLLNLVLFLIFK